MPVTMAKMSRAPKTITTNVSKADYDMIHKFANRAGASVQQVMLLGALRLITQIERGEMMQGVLREFQNGQPPGNC